MITQPEPFLGSRLPIVAAPMAGGATTVALSRAVLAAGGFPFLAAGYKSVEAMAAEIDQLRGERFGVNLFVPGEAVADAPELARYAKELQPDAEHWGTAVGQATVGGSDDGWEAKLSYLIGHPVPVVSFAFGLPSGEVLQRLREAGSTTIVTVTTTDEAAQAAKAGADALVAQGSSAGGHSSTFDATRPIPDVATAHLVREVLGSVGLPVIAAGGVDGPGAVRELMDAGAAAVAVGTLLLRAEEAGTSATHRAALADERFTETTLTRAFTGRLARGLRNGFIERHDATAPAGYPAVHYLTAPIRRSAAEAGDPDGVHLWAGTGWRAAPAWPAGDIVGWLASATGRG